MATVKTAISIDEVIDKKVKKLSKKLNMPKSQIFSQAVEYFIEKDENLELLQKINESHEPYLSKNNSQKMIHSKVIEKW
jgi:predicted DNA-binding protein